MKVILISGKAQSGKDTVASIIQDKLIEDGYSVLITHYADLLKHICRCYFGWDGKKDEKGREMLQHIGTDVIRRKNPSFWVEFTSLMLKYFYGYWDCVIIPDCRFPNEVSEMRSAGFDTTYLRVTRSNYKSILTDEQKEHPSETSLDRYDADYYIDNNGTLSDLKNKVINWIEENIYGQHKQ